MERKTDSLDQERDEHYNTKSRLEGEVQTLKDKVANVEDELERETKRGGNVLVYLFRMWRMSGRWGS